MRKLLILVSFLALTSQAVERVSLAELQGRWSTYQNQVVEITDELVVCGSYYDSLVLAEERLFCPEERAVGLADGDSTTYFQIEEENKAKSIVVHCRNAYYKVRTGDKIRRVRARVTSERHLLTGKTLGTRHQPKDRLAGPKKGELRIVGANVENYFADLGGYATKRTTQAQQEVKTQKVVKAMKKMKADIYALCEIQVGNKAPEMLLRALNKRKEKYGYVTMPQGDKDRIGGCIIYNKERVRTYGEPMSAYRDSASHYYGRMFAVGFEEKKSGERLIVSVNHFKSKRPGRNQYDTNARRMQNADSLLAMLPRLKETFGDEDILLLGDYNCYTQEQPIQTIVRAGYQELLPMGGEGDYSYSFRSEVGYLDRCFGSPSMARQVVEVRPWHVNCDWYYSHGAYKMKDKSEHRYADHEPIIVDVSLTPTLP